MTILITGGHLTPALALIDFISQHQADDKIIFVGRLYSQDRLQQLSQEKDEISKRRLKFYNLAAPRWSDFLTIKGLISLPKLIRAVGQAKQILSRERPQVVVSFGGYLALPVVLAAAMLKINIITHEQTRVAGTTNRLIGQLAKKVGVAFPETMKFFPAGKTQVVGMPLRLELFEPARPPSWLTKPLDRPILYITGGNQGSLFINQLIKNNLATLTEQFILIHQCGNPIATHNYEQQLLQARDQLSAVQQTRYVVKTWLSQPELAWIFQHAQAVVSRAGANSIAEFASYQLPALLIPLPHSSHQEQQANAAWYEHHFSARILDQATLTKESFLVNLRQLTRIKPDQVNLTKIRHQQEKVLIDLYNLLITV